MKRTHYTQRSARVLPSAYPRRNLAGTLAYMILIGKTMRPAMKIMYEFDTYGTPKNRGHNARMKAVMALDQYGTFYASARLMCQAGESYDKAVVASWTGCQVAVRAYLAECYDCRGAAEIANDIRAGDKRAGVL